MGVKRLRKLIAALSDGLSEHRQTAQVEALLAALRTAQDSPGNRKPVLAVGRDGITLCEYTYRFWEIATVRRNINDHELPSDLHRDQFEPPFRSAPQ